MTPLTAFRFYDHRHPEETALNFRIFILSHADGSSCNILFQHWAVALGDSSQSAVDQERKELMFCRALCCTVMFSKLGVLRAYAYNVLCL